MFRIKNEERLPAIVGLVILVIFHYLIISKFFLLFADYYHADSWKTFMNNYHMSGFDPISYHVITDWNLGFNVVRHPLLPFLLYPLHLLNSALWAITGVNCTQFVMGGLLLFCGFYAFIFLFRIIHRYIGLKKADALLLSVFFYSFAYVLLTMIVADHFCLSLFCIMLTLLTAARKMKEGGKYSVIETVALFVLTAGITLTNGIVVFLAVLFVNGKSFFSWRFLTKAVILPAAVLFAFGLAVHNYDTHESLTTIHKPQYKHTGESLTEKGLLSWTDISTPRTTSIVENFFGESIQLHRQYILGDVLTLRPVIVKYDAWYHYLVEAVIVILLLLGIWAGRHARFLWLSVAIFGYNVLLHIVLGFALNEVYIMTAHWAFVIPLSAAYLFKTGHPWQHHAVRIVTVVVTVWLWAYHLPLLYRYLTWPLKM